MLFHCTHTNSLTDDICLSFSSFQFFRVAVNHFNVFAIRFLLFVYVLLIFQSEMSDDKDVTSPPETSTEKTPIETKDEEPVARVIKPEYEGLLNENGDSDGVSH